MDTDILDGTILVRLCYSVGYTSHMFCVARLSRDEVLDMDTDILNGVM
jgi:hypothetical protein